MRARGGESRWPRSENASETRPATKGGQRLGHNLNAARRNVHPGAIMFRQTGQGRIFSALLSTTLCARVLVTEHALLLQARLRAHTKPPSWLQTALVSSQSSQWRYFLHGAWPRCVLPLRMACEEPDVPTKESFPMEKRENGRLSSILDGFQRDLVLSQA